MQPQGASWQLPSCTELAPGRPVVLTVPQRADEVHWSAGNGSTVVSVSTTLDSFFKVGVAVNGSEWLESSGVLCVPTSLKPNPHFI